MSGFSSTKNGTASELTIGVRCIRSVGAIQDSRQENRDFIKIFSYLWLLNTVDEWIAGEADGTGADGIVIDHLALGVRAARSRTRVHAGLAHAGLTQPAVRTEEALGAAVGRRAKVSRLAGAGRPPAALGATDAVGTAGVRHTGVLGPCHHWFHCRSHNKGIRVR
jgi:hypothetical protein